MTDFLARQVLPTVLNMSLTASVVIGCVLLARLLLRRAPKVFSYGLWAVVLFRLICPVSVTAHLSLLRNTPHASSTACLFSAQHAKQRKCRMRQHAL